MRTSATWLDDDQVHLCLVVRGNQALHTTQLALLHAIDGTVALFTDLFHVVRMAEPSTGLAR